MYSLELFIDKIMMDSNNTTMGFCGDRFYYDRSISIPNIIWSVSGFICLIIGIPSHILHITVLLIATNRKETFSVYYIAIATCELVFLLGLY